MNGAVQTRSKAMVLAACVVDGIVDVGLSVCGCRRFVGYFVA